MILQRLPHFILFGAVLVDLLFGELPDRYHPVVWMGNYIKIFWEKRITKSSGTLFLTGFFLLFSGMAVFAFIPWFIVRVLPVFLSVVFSIMMLTTVFSIRALIRAAREVQSALNNDNLDKARELTAWHLVSRDTSDLSAGEIISATIESVAENITDGFTSPLLFFAIGGLPAAWGYRFTNTSDSMIAYRKDDKEWGGKMTAWLDDIFNWIPARLTGIIICAAAFILKEDWRNSLKTMKGQNRATSSPNAGWTMAAMAGALNITLQKKGDYTLNGGSEVVNFQFIDRAIRIALTTMVIILIVCFSILEVLYWLNT